MDERDNGRFKGEVGIEESLAAYYGPKLPEQPLSASSWQKVQQQLGPQRSTRRLTRLRQRLRKPYNPVPDAAQQIFRQLIVDAHLAYPFPTLQYSYKARQQEPAVQVKLLSRTIKLMLPFTLNLEQSAYQAILDVLLATGIARYQLMRRVSYYGLFLLWLTCIIASIILLLILKDTSHFNMLAFLIAILLCSGDILGLLLVMRQQRSIVLASDALAVRWLGRERICRGLHELAERSRNPYRRHLGQPSLAERIERVCGPRVETRDKHLTLVS